MEVKEFFSTYKRLCKDQKGCMTCPLGCGMEKTHCMVKKMIFDLDYNTKETVEIVEKWGDEHPAKTYAQDLTAKFPYLKGKDFYGDICRDTLYNFDKISTSHCTHDCNDCWNMPMEE